jgi:hypothetical protein
MHCVFDGGESRAADIFVGNTIAYIVEHAYWDVLGIGSGKL